MNIIMIISSLFLFGSAPSLRAGPRCFREAASQKVYPLLLRFNNSNYGRPKIFIFILFRPRRRRREAERKHQNTKLINFSKNSSSFGSRSVVHGPGHHHYYLDSALLFRSSPERFWRNDFAADQLDAPDWQ